MTRTAIDTTDPQREHNLAPGILSITSDDAISN
jgi:hypothetical protein